MALLVFVPAVPSGAQDKPTDKGQDPRKQDERNKLTPEEMARRKVEALKDAEDCYKKFKTWTAKVRITESTGQDTRIGFEGTVWVKVGENDNRMLFWDIKQWEEQIDESNNEIKRVTVDTQRSLYKGTDLQIAFDTRKILEIYQLAVLDIFVPQFLVRDGFTKKLDEYFQVEIVANPKYRNTEWTETSWAHLGFKSKEAWEDWYKNKKAKNALGRETGAKEFGTHDDKMNKMDKQNPRNKLPGNEGKEAEHYYVIHLTPMTPFLKRDVSRVTINLRPGDFLPVSILVRKTDDATMILNFESIEKDPVGDAEIKDERFQLDVPGYTRRYPQKE